MASRATGQGTLSTSWLTCTIGLATVGGTGAVPQYTLLQPAWRAAAGRGAYSPPLTTGHLFAEWPNFALDRIHEIMYNMIGSVPLLVCPAVGTTSAPSTQHMTPREAVAGSLSRLNPEP